MRDTALRLAIKLQKEKDEQLIKLKAENEKLKSNKLTPENVISAVMAIVATNEADKIVNKVLDDNFISKQKVNDIYIEMVDEIEEIYYKEYPIKKGIDNNLQRFADILKVILRAKQKLGIDEK